MRGRVRRHLGTNGTQYRTDRADRLWKYWSSDMARLQFVFRNLTKETVPIFVEPWAAEVPILPDTQAEVVCEDIDPEAPVLLSLADDCFIIDASLNIRIRYDGKDYEFKDSDDPQSSRQHPDFAPTEFAANSCPRNSKFLSSPARA
jgi:hypothetical protein